jgi:hypothetical protein
MDSIHCLSKLDWRIHVVGKGGISYGYGADAMRWPGLDSTGCLGRLMTNGTT